MGAKAFGSPLSYQGVCGRHGRKEAFVSQGDLPASLIRVRRGITQKESQTIGLNSAWPLLSEVRAVCSSAARTDLVRGAARKSGPYRDRSPTPIAVLGWTGFVAGGFIDRGVIYATFQMSIEWLTSPEELNRRADAGSSADLRKGSRHYVLTSDFGTSRPRPLMRSAADARCSEGGFSKCGSRGVAGTGPGLFWSSPLRSSMRLE